MFRVSAKGPLRVPKAIRERLNLREGDRFAFVEGTGKMIGTNAAVLALGNLPETMQPQVAAQGLV